MCSYQNHLQSIDDLITTYEAIRAGFVALALEKNRRATPFVAEARALKEAASQAESGELKGGIDPAGADEHWKTAQAALNRIREAFSRVGHSPLTFFVGSAIARRMAGEIWNQLENGTLSNAANLNQENQVVSISR
ncbi:MAG: AvaI/BsoBI family type II restriction endonuclease [Nostoc sp.]